MKLKDELEKLKRSVEASRNKPPEGTDDLAQGDEYLPLDYRLAFRINNTFRTEKSGWLKVDMTWNQIFSAIAPSLMHEASLKELQNKLEIAVGLRQGEIIAKIAAEHSSEEKKLDYDSTEIWSMGFDTVVVQLKALGLIQQSQRIRSLKDQKTYWSLTPFGDSQMTRLRAVKKLNLTLSA